MQRFLENWKTSSFGLATIASTSFDAFGRHGSGAIGGWHIVAILLGTALLFARDFDK